MTGSWSRRALGEVLSVQNGYAFDSKAFGTTGFPLIRIRDLKAGVSTETRYGAEFDSRYVVTAGDFLIGMDGEFGCYEWKGEPALLNQRVCRLQGFGEALTPRFLFYGINTHLKAIEEVTGYTTVKHLSSKQILGIEMLIPPLDEQRRIVAILDEAFEGIATAKANAAKNLQNGRELFARLSAALLDQLAPVSRTVTLEEIAEPGCSLSYGIVQPGQELTDGLPIVRPVDLNDGVVTLDGLKRIDPTLAKPYERTTLKGHEILLCVRGTTGSMALADSELAGANVTRGIVPIRFNEAHLSQDFGYFLMRSEAVQMQIRAKTYGTALMQINIRDLRRITLPIPPKKEQEMVVMRFDELKAATDRLVATYESKLAALNELKESLLQQAFSGQLTSSEQTKIAQQQVLQTTTPEFSANIISLAYARHERQKREKTFGHVKEQKLLHLVESIAGIDLGRQPMRDAAGPNDFQHMLRADNWAKAHGFYDMVKRGEGYEFSKLSSFDEYASRARQALAPYLSRLEPVIDLLVPMDTEEAEVFTTVHAAWNNLLIDGVQATDDAIVSAARQEWHPDKLRIPEHKFRGAIEKIRQKRLGPDGSAKYVGGQKALFDEAILPVQKR